VNDLSFRIITVKQHADALDEAKGLQEFNSGPERSVIPAEPTHLLLVVTHRAATNTSRH
jgi:hypothetical protein